MEPTFSKEQMILASRCDSTGRLGVSDCFDLFMDAATEHAEDLEGGFTALGRKNQFWITVKTRVDFVRRPGLTETVTVTTRSGARTKLRAISACAQIGVRIRFSAVGSTIGPPAERE